MTSRRRDTRADALADGRPRASTSSNASNGQEARYVSDTDNRPSAMTSDYTGEIQR
jgi:hypothetical protein